MKPSREIYGEVRSDVKRTEEDRKFLTYSVNLRDSFSDVNYSPLIKLSFRLGIEYDWGSISSSLTSPLGSCGP